jgi:L-2-hydroxyglutarate oxidase LhgO
MHSSSRNSEVIHAGIYYPKDSLKARLCVQGNRLLYEFCESRNVVHRRIGKLILATDENDLGKLYELQQQAQKNGVNDLHLMSADQVRELEPELQCVAALLSPSTGIVDSHELMVSLQAEFEAKGGAVVLNSRVDDVGITDDGFEFNVDGEVFACMSLVNSAGLGAVKLAVGAPDERDRGHGPLLQQYFAKGHYFAYQGKSPFRHLVYPVPSAGGLGIHATNDLAGSARFGPDVTWIDEVDYDFDDSRKPDFVAAIQRYYPGLDASKLAPAYTGIRPRLHGAGKPAVDFVIQGEADHGVRGLVNLFGIESPGLTCSLAIGEYVKEILF